MGYFSEFAINDVCLEDYSYPSPKMQLEWRIEDLFSRLEDISPYDDIGAAASCMDCRFSDDDLAYALPKDFFRVGDILAAIEKSQHKLDLLEAEAAKENAEIPGQCVILTVLTPLYKRDSPVGESLLYVTE